MESALRTEAKDGGTVQPMTTTIGAFATSAAIAGALLPVASLATSGDPTSVDRELLLAIRGASDHHGTTTSALKSVMLGFTAAGAFPTLAAITLLVTGFLVAAGHRKQAFRLVAVVLATIAAANLIKNVFDRARPDVVAHWVAVSSYSFPSGHAADSAVTYLLLAAVACERTRGTFARNLIAGAALAVVVLIGFSRLYLGVHWPTDVLAGWAFGAASAYYLAPFVLAGPRGTR